MKQLLCHILLGTVLLGTAVGQTTVANGIVGVDPASAPQGTNGLIVTFTLGSGLTPPVPQAGIAPSAVTLGTNVGASITHATQYAVTARFDLSATEPAGWKDAAITFPRPSGGPVTYSGLQVFQVVPGSGLAANFSGAPTRGSAPVLVQFTDGSTGTITNRLWDFGDGGFNSSNHPAHTYSQAGSYRVRLTVFGPGGSNQLERPDYVIVTAPVTNNGAYVLVDTAQTNAYNNSSPIVSPAAGQPFFGQDAQHAANPPRYRENGDGTVSDLVTGLMWQQDPGPKVTYTAALSGAASLALGGHTDWRVPTIKELFSLILFSGLDASSCMAPGAGACGAVPFLDTNYFRFQYGDTNAGERIIDAQYWSSTEYVSTTMGGDATVFGVNFADGRIKGYPRDTGPSGPLTEFCRYVRGNPVYGINRFTNHNDGTVTDQATWRMWARADSGTGLGWSNALAWVQARNAEKYLGYTDWRLPDAKELQSLVDYTRSPATTASAAIDPVFQSTAIVNEAGQTDWPAYWSSTTHVSANGNCAWAVYVCFGRAMGYMNSTWMDVHGAGAQRSDPKTGSAADYPAGHGPQGDAVRVTNYVRLIRTTSPNADTVGDGIPDWWRRQYFGSATGTNFASCATCDPDLDGADNAHEYVADTVPTNTASCFRIQSVSAGPGCAVRFPSSANRTYTLCRATNLAAGGWSPVASQTSIPGSGGVDALTDPAPAGPALFYRVRVELP